MKILSVIVPCYNSQNYMERCIDSLLPGGNDVEIIIVNDGSTDETGAVAEAYRRQYPDVVLVIHQENRGHGGAINTGLARAGGAFIKVVDSDDWVDEAAYGQILKTLKGFPETARPDVVISNYVYEKEGKRRKMVIRYSPTLPEGRVFTWAKCGRLPKGRYILMHSIIYRRGIMDECKLLLPEHTFYVDNLYAYIPLRYTKTLYYLDVDFYRYYIGRAGQSVHEAVMIRHIDQQLFVNRLMVSAFAPEAVKEKRKRRYLLNYLEIVTLASSAMLLRGGTEEHLRKKRELWQYIHANNKWLYKKLRHGFLAQLVHLPGNIGRHISVSIYHFSRLIVGFN
ncbi:MAG: glycosyltransferase family 2 protein [Treponema sp.]|jgi:glycosyltransferase involved in cell wall biosynthesis|nr:glycosyltransferase family 2 protein [Treponema sp.]